MQNPQNVLKWLSFGQFARSAYRKQRKMVFRIYKTCSNGSFSGSLSALHTENSGKWYSENTLVRSFS